MPDIGGPGRTSMGVSVTLDGTVVMTGGGTQLGYKNDVWWLVKGGGTAPTLGTSTSGFGIDDFVPRLEGAHSR